MKLLKGMFSDCAEVDQPSGTYRYAKNIVDGNTVGAKENEDGFESIGVLAPYSVIGIIPIERDFVVFSTNNTNSEIGLVSNGIYTQIYNNNSLNFDTASPIKGEFRKDVNNNRIITWVDDINPPRILNIDDLSGVNDVNDLELFQDITNPTLSSYSINNTGGALKTGAITLITRYKNSDGSETDWFVHEHVFYINDDSTSVSFNNNDGSLGGITTNKSITASFTGLDTRYDTLVIGYIQATNGVLTTYEVKSVDNQSSLTTTITGSETVTEITLDEVLTNTANYSNAKAITQLNGRLFLGNLTADSIPDLQAIACAIKINYNVSLVNVVSNTNSHKDTLPPTFIPGEVYAFYLGVELNRGGWAYYHIPGRAALADGEVYSVSSFGFTHYYFQVENTSDKTGTGAETNMGYWENINEVYPNTTEFNGSASGHDVRGLGVRHHRFPTLSSLVTNYYSGDTTVGVTNLPRLGINVSNVNIPAELQGQIKRWKIFYAKKDTNNSLFMSDDLTQFSFHTETDSNIRWGTGGNWGISAESGGVNTWKSMFTAYVHRDRLRAHCIAVEDKAGFIPNYSTFAYKLKRSGLNYQYTGFGSTGGMLTLSGKNIGGVAAEVGKEASAVVDYTANTVRSSVGSTGFTIKVNNTNFLPQNALNNNASTQYTEGVFDITLNEDPNTYSTLNLSTLYTNSTGQNCDNYQFNLVLDDGYEETFYQQYFRYLSDVHTSVFQQDLIPLESYSSASTSSLSNVYGGNGFLCYQSYLSCGPLNANPNTTLGNPYEEGVRTWKAYVGYSNKNLNFRYQTIGDSSTYYHGKTDVRSLFTPYASSATVGHDILFKLDSSVNNLQYNTDYNQMNEFITGVIWSPTLIQETSFPNTVIYTPVQSEGSKEFTWRTFLSGDSYTIQKNKGDIVNLQGIANKELIIHTRYSIFRTRTDAKAGVDGENIFYKSANLFDLPPEELVPTPNGYGGTQNKMACVLTKAGYAYVDDLQGKVFLYNGQLEEISSNGLRQFFRDYMQINADNNDNPFNDYGYTISFDERFNRLLVAKKYDTLSWTISFNPLTKSWVSYHDWFPDYIFSTVEGFTYGIKNNEFFYMNRKPMTTTKGIYFDATTYPSFIDVVHNEEPYSDKEFVAANWITEVYPNGMTSGQVDTTLNYTTTCDYITFYTPQHCSGRIPLALVDDIDTLYTSNLRNLNRTWYFNGIRDIALTTGFLNTFYNNYTIDTTKLNTSMEWYDQRRFIDKYVTCRYEFSNLLNYRFLFLESNIQYKNATR